MKNILSFLGGLLISSVVGFCFAITLIHFNFNQIVAPVSALSGILTGCALFYIVNEED